MEIKTWKDVAFWVVTTIGMLGAIYLLSLGWNYDVTKPIKDADRAWKIERELQRDMDSVEIQNYKWHCKEFTAPIRDVDLIWIDNPKKESFNPDFDECLLTCHY